MLCDDNFVGENEGARNGPNWRKFVVWGIRQREDEEIETKSRESKQRTVL
jgi:hypothetical protein